MAKSIKLSELSNVRMVGGNEKKIRKVILGGEVYEWVGIGWVPVGSSVPSDNKKYPTVEVLE